MPERCSFDYAVVRVAPRPDREEFVNAGVILFCSEQNFLGARVALREKALRALCPSLDLDDIGQRLRATVRIAEGERGAGPVAALSRRERFHWLVAPRSTVIQVSAVHSGLCVRAEESLEKLFVALVGEPV